MTDQLSCTGKQWHVPADTAVINASHVLIRLLRQREINPDVPTPLSSPTVYPDISKAVRRIQQAISDQQKIGIFGDYDCDGITAVAQLVRYCRRHQVEPYVRLPHRVTDGYGLNAAIVEELIAANIDLLITADTGVTATVEIATLQDAGIDTIVTDHHHTPPQLPDAIIIHPSVAGLPEPHPSGAGVVLQLLHALEGSEWPDMAFDYALAMIGTVADVVPLQGENRTLTQVGLRALQSLTSGPLYELCHQVCADMTTLTSTDVAFRIAPRINAAGRMADPYRALTALLEGGSATQELDALNHDRQQQTQTLFAEITQQLPDPLPPLITAISNDYPHGLLGLLAGKLTEQYGRPSLVAHDDGNNCTASLRSPPSYHITEGLNRIAVHLDRYGGHGQAAGCTFASKDSGQVISHLAADIATHVSAEQLVPTLMIDAVLTPDLITLDFCEQLRLLEPYGQGNPEPLFLLRNVTLTDKRLCGTDSNHLQAKLGPLKCIGFGLGHLYDTTTCDLVVRLGIDTWNGNRRPQLFIADIAVAKVEKVLV